MPVSGDVSCCVEYCRARGKRCVKHGETHVFLNYQQGGFLAEKRSALLQDNMGEKCSSLANRDYSQQEMLKK